MKLAIALIVCVLIALTCLYLYIRSVPVEKVAISDLDPSDAGKLVRVEGYVKDIHRYSAGHVLLNLTDLKGYVDAYLPSSVVGGVDAKAYVPGAFVSVAGEVTVYNGGLEIMVKSPSDLQLLSPAGGREIPVKTIVSVPEVLEGMKLTTHGEILSIKESTGNLTIRATDPQNLSIEILIIVDKTINETIIYRDVIDVYGEFTYGYEFRTGWRIVVHLPGHGVSRNGVPNASTSVKLGDVLSNPQAYANKSVHVEGLLVMNSQTVRGSGFKLNDELMSITCFIYWYEWKRTDVVEHDLVRLTGTLQYYPPQGAWRLVTDAQSDLVKL